MSLTRQDELDLAGLVSEVGDPGSRARAQDLAALNPEAAEFSRQIRVVCQALTAEAESSPPPLSAEEADALAAVISARAGRTRVKRGFAFGRRWQWVGIAAAVAIAAVGWLSLTWNGQPIVAEAIAFPVFESLNEPGASKPHRFPVRTDELVETIDEYAVFNFTNGNRTAIGPGTRLTILDAGQIMALQKGTLFIHAQVALRVRISDTVIILNQDRSMVMIQAEPRGSICAVYSGSAKFIGQRHDIQISTGQVGTWDKAGGGLRIDAFPPELPDWVQSAWAKAQP